ncbi:hypothetical protein ACI2KR_09350 [Pseudomonas luteola]
MTTTALRYFVRNDAISIMMPDALQPMMVRSDHSNFAGIVQAAKANDYEKILTLLDPVQAFCDQLDGRLVKANGSLYFDGTEVHTSLTRKIVDMASRGENPLKFIKFMENLLQNPEERAILELYGFVENNTLPISEDGYLLAYKTVRRDFLDHYSKTVYYAPGESVSMPRDKVNNDPEVTCSTGLHVCSVGYIADAFFGGDKKSRLILVKVNPKDVVCVPKDYENSKVRCCAMHVLAEFGIRSGRELKGVDKAVQQNLDVLGKHLRLSEQEFRSIIGLMRDEYGVEDFGDFGEIMSFPHKKKTSEGHLIRLVPPTKPLGTGLDLAQADIRERFSEIVGERFKLTSLTIENRKKAYGKQPISLDTRLILVEFECFKIYGQEIHSLSELQEFADTIDSDKFIPVDVSARLYVKTEDKLFDKTSQA